MISLENKKKTVAIIGGGTAGLMVAAQVDEKLFDVTIYERNVAFGRKFLVAGDGGLNLTHSENIQDFVSRYQPAEFFEPILTSFNNTDFRDWLHGMGIETYIGTSKRVFPVKGTKPIDVLNAIINVLEKKGVHFKFRHEWKGWNNGLLSFLHLNSEVDVNADIVVFALGGSSWKVTGSDGNWVSYFEKKGIEIVPFEPSNCALEVKWEKGVLEQAEGKSLKNISLQCGQQVKKGEIVVTQFGLEGGAVYALSGAIREQLRHNGIAKLMIDFKPTLSNIEIENKLRNRGRKSLGNYLKTELHLSDAAIAVIKGYTSKEEFISERKLTEKIKRLTINITATAAINEAISTVGGVSLDEIDATFQLKKLPNHYVVGEMLDWDAPTGGYLLQGCMSMGYVVGNILANSK